MKNAFQCLISLGLALTVCLNLSTQALSAYEPNSSHENYVYEYTDYTDTGTITVSEHDAAVTELVTDILAQGIGRLIRYAFSDLPAGDTPSVVSTLLAKYAAKNSPLNRWGDYKVSTRYETKYSVDMYTGKRTVVAKWLWTRYDLTQNGYDISSKEVKVRIK